VYYDGDLATVYEEPRLRLLTRIAFVGALSLTASAQIAQVSGADKPDQVAPAPVAPSTPAARYEWCIKLAKSSPSDGWEAALAWTGEGGGDPARHCAAVALIGLKQYKQAGERLEELAQGSMADKEVRAGMLAQAGQAWLLADNVDRAYADQTTALQLMPGTPDLLIDRAESLALSKNWKEAVADLNQALAASPNRVDALVYRATAERFLGDLGAASVDAAKAIALDAKAEDAWLESGVIKRLKGDDAGARRDWLHVLELAPNSPSAQAARENLERFDVKQ
jgi:tetratricopeptide (TPR) repeat protein